jgi:hypothetical protein
MKRYHQRIKCPSATKLLRKFPSTPLRERETPLAERSRSATSFLVDKTPPQAELVANQDYFCILSSSLGECANIFLIFISLLVVLLRENFRLNAAKTMKITKIMYAIMLPRLLPFKVGWL